MWRTAVNPGPISSYKAGIPDGILWEVAATALETDGHVSPQLMLDWSRYAVSNRPDSLTFRAACCSHFMFFQEGQLNEDSA